MSKFFYVFHVDLDIFIAHALTQHNLYMYTYIYYDASSFSSACGHSKIEEHLSYISCQVYPHTLSLYHFLSSFYNS